MFRIRRRWFVPVLVLVVTAGLVTVAVTYSSGQDAPTSTERGGAATVSPSAAAGDGPASDVVGAERTPGDTARRSPNDPLALGPVDAPVALVVYADYQCPYCALWSHDTLPTMRKYAKRGELRIEWRQLNIFGPASARASKAAYAAALQGQFWPYHDALYAGGEHRTESELSRGALVEVAVSLGLDRARFVADVASKKVAQAVQRDEQEGYDLGVLTTPSFLINGKPIVGAQPTSVFTKAVDAALANR